MSLGELGTGERDDEDRMAARPFQQVLHELHQAGIRPVHVLEHKDDRPGFGEPLEEEPPGRVQILACAVPARAKAQQLLQVGLDPGALVRLVEMRRDQAM